MVGLTEWTGRVLAKLGTLGIRPLAEEAGEEDEHWLNVRDYYGFYLNPPLAEADLLALEDRHGFRLPQEYRRFLLDVGDGGYGPGAGLEAFGRFLGKHGPAESPARLARRFPLDESLFLTPDAVRRPDWAETQTRFQHGTLPLAHYGCGICAVLIVNGARAGEVWIEDLANDYGVVEARDHWMVKNLYASCPDRVTFAAWYELWLDAQLRRWGQPE
jgi:SMI1 / KNR4 family (SUKH-1)